MVLLDATGKMIMKCRPLSIWWLCAAVCMGLPAEGRTPRSFPHEDTQYVSLTHLAHFYGLGRVVEEGDSFLLNGDRIHIEFVRDSRIMKVNHTIVWLHEPVRRVRRRWALSEADVRVVIDPLLRTNRHLARAGWNRIVLDPGHGGGDRGAVSPGGLTEKELTLDIAQRVRSLLLSEGIEVFMTRDTDRAIPISERIQLTKDWNADAFISIHFNFASNPNARGTESFVLPGAGLGSTASNNPRGEYPETPGNMHDGANAILGYHIQRHLLKQTGNADRGVRRARFAVLRDAPCPAVLVECAFLSYAPEEALLSTESYRDALARGIAGGILDYIATVQRVTMGVR